MGSEEWGGLKIFGYGILKVYFYYIGVELESYVWRMENIIIWIVVVIWYLGGWIKVGWLKVFKVGVVMVGWNRWVLVRIVVNYKGKWG